MFNAQTMHILAQNTSGLKNKKEEIKALILKSAQQGNFCKVIKYVPYNFLEIKSWLTSLGFLVCTPVDTLGLVMVRW